MLNKARMFSPIPIPHVESKNYRKEDACADTAPQTTRETGNPEAQKPIVNIKLQTPKRLHG